MIMKFCPNADFLNALRVWPLWFVAFFLFGVPHASIPVSVAVYSVVDGFFSAFLKCLRAVGFLWQLFFESSTWHNKIASVRLPPVARLSSNKQINEPSWKTRKNWRFERKFGTEDATVVVTREMNSGKIYLCQKSLLQNVVLKKSTSFSFFIPSKSISLRLWFLEE